MRGNAEKMASIADGLNGAGLAMALHLGATSEYTRNGATCNFSLDPGEATQSW